MFSLSCSKGCLKKSGDSISTLKLKVNPLGPNPDLLNPRDLHFNTLSP